MGLFSVLGDVLKVAAPIVGTVVGGPFGSLIGSGISKAIGGIQQGSQASALEKNNARPVDSPESQYYQNEAEANANAQNGIGTQQYQNAQDDIQRNQQFGLRAATQRGGGLSTISGLVDAGNRATNSLNAEDDAARVRNQQMAYQIRTALARRRASAFDWNSKQKFLENAAAIRALKASSAQNIWGGLNTIGTGAAMQMNGGVPSTGGGGFSLSNLLGGGGSNVTGGYSDSSPVSAGQDITS